MIINNSETSDVKLTLTTYNSLFLQLLLSLGI